MVWARGNNLSGGRVRGRPRLHRMDGVKVALGNRGMTVEAARQCAKDRKQWRVSGTYVTELVARTWPLLLGPVFWFLSPGEGWDAVT